MLPGETAQSLGRCAALHGSALARVLDEAEKVAKKAGDSFVPVERILMALALVASAGKTALEAGAVSAQKLNAAINDIRKGRTADTASAEEGYDALKNMPATSPRPPKRARSTRSMGATTRSGGPCKSRVAGGPRTTRC